MIINEYNTPPKLEAISVWFFRSLLSNLRPRKYAIELLTIIKLDKILIRYK